MVVSAETAQLDLLCVLDLLCITVTPLDGHIRVGIGINKNVECAVSVQDR